MLTRLLNAMARELVAELDIARETLPPTDRPGRNRSSLPSPTMSLLEEKCDRQFIELSQRLEACQARLVKQAKIIDYHSGVIGGCQNLNLRTEELRERISLLELRANDPAT